MKNGSSWAGPWTTEEIDRAIQRAIDDCSCLPWKHPSLGYPGTAPDPIAIAVNKVLIEVNPNNIGTHAMPMFCEDEDATEHGFGGTQRLEREAIAFLAEMAGGNPKEIDGYLTHGGTEANIVGLWLGRNRLLHELRKQHSCGSIDDIALVTSGLTHYSAIKAANILGWSDGGVNLVGCTPTGEIAQDLLFSRITQLRTDGKKAILLCLTAGATMTGSVDPTKEIVDSMKAWSSESGIPFYVHVDAAFGGFVLPFLQQPIAFGFDCGADSVTIDPHKMGGVPFGCGAVLYRHEYQRFITTPAPYINSEVDSTLSGSRSGIPAAMLWATMRSRGVEGYQKIVQECLDTAEYLHDELQQLGTFTLIKGKTNQVCAIITARSDAEKLERLHGHSYYVHVTRFPLDLSQPGLCDGYAIKLIVMPHVTREMIDGFVNEVKRWL